MIRTGHVTIIQSRTFFKEKQGIADARQRCHDGGGQNKDSEEEGVSFDHCQEYEMKGEQYGHAIKHVDDDKPQAAHRPTRNGPGAPTSVPLRRQPTRRTESFRKKAVRLH